MIVAIAVFGPLFAPHSPTELLGAPFQTPSARTRSAPTTIGEDVLSRVLCGGRTVIVYGFLATVLAYLDRRHDRTRRRLPARRRRTPC